ncbi:phosphatase PAP2 family protein [Sphingomonas sp. CGMCC 1.13654]|uniref:Phosphatase PAP2 family protein n=1 Tax=Sphingomonas chungangi TaxID=2683589 RepID=A0A838L6G1_9SPHN|nr:phosphatase PAP2 family protein [Sphingomonas chungangi]MBA2934232.1 phosphatase PAP2 family protein [Sphingomonas chungangi]MVW57273.1 inositol phosphorylceramide synthase [Sphingomonas chungangi]
MSRPIRIPVEVAFTGAMVFLMLLLSAWYHLPIRLPSGSGADVMGVQLFLPLAGIGVWLAFTLLTNRKASPWRPLLALACYAIVMVVHFNLKLWVPFVRTADYDPILWQMDQMARPVVDACIAMRVALRPLLYFWKSIYLWSFLSLFYISFGYHAIRTPDVFRKLFLAALFLQGMGAIGYLLLPAIGPFIYETGTSAAITQAQHDMLAVRQMSVAAGPQWLSDNGSANLFAGLGAMPSLHAGCSFLFLWFAWKHGRALLPTYIPIFAYILVTAIASRWHYLIDLPVGIALARLAIHLAHVADRPRAEADTPVSLAEPVLA